MESLGNRRGYCNYQSLLPLPSPPMLFHVWGQQRTHQILLGLHSLNVLKMTNVRTQWFPIGWEWAGPYYWLKKKILLNGRVDYVILFFEASMAPHGTQQKYYAGLLNLAPTHLSNHIISWIFPTHVFYPSHTEFLVFPRLTILSHFLSCF